MNEPTRKIKTCFTPAYEADTPTASMRKLAPVARAAVAAGLAELVEPGEMDILGMLKDCNL